jgi:hypothetical protein
MPRGRAPPLCARNYRKFNGRILLPGPAILILATIIVDEVFSPDKN